MIQTIFNKGAIPIAEQELYFSAMRHDAIANNVANAETPKYRAIDAPVAEFQEAMKRALRQRDRMRIPVFSFRGYGGVMPKPGGGTEIEFQEIPEHTLLDHLENNVDMELEQAKMVKNAMRHNLVATILAHQFSLLREAIGERVAT